VAETVTFTPPVMILYSKPVTSGVVLTLDDNNTVTFRIPQLNPAELSATFSRGRVLDGDSSSSSSDESELKDLSDMTVSRMTSRVLTKRLDSPSPANSDRSHHDDNEPPTLTGETP
jgi:hypothetical protein